jgi:hypothetical protein
VAEGFGGDQTEAVLFTYMIKFYRSHKLNDVLSRSLCELNDGLMVLMMY